MNKAVILIVDDNEKHADLISESVNTPGVKTRVIYDGKEALRFIEQNQIDLIISELNLDTDVNGLDILRAAKDADLSTAVILTASNPSIDTCKEAIRGGACDYLEKPVDLDVLQSKVATLLQQAGCKS